MNDEQLHELYVDAFRMVSHSDDASSFHEKHLRGSMSSSNDGALGLHHYYELQPLVLVVVFLRYIFFVVYDYF